ncbi:MAG: peptidase M20 [Lysobacterales bacterium 63-13]|nr:MAG: peptidase M20 [Xanthomonadales bacterium 63-13]
MKTLLASAMALSLPLLAHAADTPRFDGKRLSEQVKTLSSDAFEGRGPATAGEEKTIAYVVAQMQEAGLQPGGDLKDGKRQWTQAVPLLRAEIKGTPKLSLTVGGKSEALSQGEQVAIRAATDGSTAVDVKNVPLVFVGYGVHAPERKWNDFDGVDLKGKIAIALINDPDFETGEGDFGGKAMTYYGRWTYKYEEAARQGAIGLLVVHETAPASYGWATVKNSNTNTMFDVVRDNPRSVHPQIEGWIQRDAAASLFKQAGLDFDALKAQAQKRGFKAVPLKDATFSASYAVDAKVITSHNIVARIEGSKRPDETIIYSAHWDHLGIGLADAEGDTIYNGAVDNATGTAALIEIGRAFAKAPPPQRSVVFLNVTAEEKGLLGSEYYSSKPLYPLARTVAVINMDALDPFGESRNFTTSGSAQSELLDALVAEGKAAGMTYVSDRHPEAGYFFRSDHFPFAKRGVPALSWGSGNDWVDGGTEAGEAAGKDYVAKRYHQPADEWDANWTFAGMVHDLPILYRLGNDLANSTRWPHWGADSEFRAIREATAAQRK